MIVPRVLRLRVRRNARAAHTSGPTKKRNVFKFMNSGSSRNGGLFKKCKKSVTIVKNEGNAPLNIAEANNPLSIFSQCHVHEFSSSKPFIGVKLYTQ